MSIIRRVEVAASGRYDVYIGKGLLDTLDARIHALLPQCERLAIVTDDTVAPLYTEHLAKTLSMCAGHFVVPHGEGSKTGERYLWLVNQLAQCQLTRSDAVVAVGGGMVGDLTGFAAATLLRGIPCIQVPTTLLAQVDSSVGGKTAIDLPIGKNLVGAFSQPALVLCDLDTLDTLPESVFLEGCAEVIKYGILRDAALFAHLETHGPAFDRLYVVETCVAIKRDYVCADEFDTGLRRELNLGHTFGHAVEHCSQYTLSHGASVAIGTATVARAAAQAGLCTREDAQRMIALLEKFQLPTQLPSGQDLEQIFQVLLADKKRTGSKLHVVVPERIGKCRVVPMGRDEAIAFFRSGVEAWT